MSVRVSKELRKIATERSRALREKQTEAELVLWQYLRDRRFRGIKVRRQHPVYYEEESKTSFFVADFYIEEVKLLVELDGEIHQFQISEDKLRENIIQRAGYTIIRFTNADVLGNIELTLKSLKEKLNNLQL